MNDVIGISDVSSLDTGRGKSASLKTGGIRRNYNMKKNKGLKSACWKGYEAVGFKMKGGRKVPNCVPVAKKKK